MLRKKNKVFFIKPKKNSILHSELRIRNGSSKELSSPICVGLSNKNSNLFFFFELIKEK